MSIKLTERAVRDARPKAAYYEVSDAGNPLSLRVKTNGEKLWVYRGKDANGVRTKVTIGFYPEMSLFDARVDALKRKQAAKLAPKAPKPSIIHHHHRKTGMTVDQAIAAYFRDEANDLRSVNDIRSNFRRFVSPVIGSKLLADVTKQDCRDCLVKPLETMKGAGVNRVLAHLKRFLAHCVERDYIEVNPALSIVKLAKENDRDRVLDRHELGYVQAALPAAGKYASAFELLLLTLVRRSDILELTWGEVGDDHLDIRRTKNGKPHLAYLTERAKRCIPARPDGAKDTDRVFIDCHPDGSGDYLKELRLVATALAENDGKSMDHFQLHDFRGTGVTHIAAMLDDDDRQKFPPEVRSALLNHTPAGVTSKHYDKHIYWKERKAALIAWDEFLASCET